METDYLITLTVFCACFAVCYMGLRAAAGHLDSFAPPNSLRRDVYLPLYLTSFAAAVLLMIFLPDHSDQIFPVAWTELLTVFVGAGVVYLAFIMKKTAKLAPLALLAVITLAAFLLPSGFRLFELNLPLILDRAILILLWFLFAYCYQYLNGIDGMLTVQNVTAAGGVFLLALLGAVPWLVGDLSVALLGVFAAFAIFNWYPAKLNLKPGGCVALGLILGWLLVVTCREGSAGSALILTLYYAVEMLWAALQKLSLKPERQDLLLNTVYYQTNVSGLSPAVVSQNIFKIEGLLVIISCFQIFSPNYYSLPGLAFLLTLWFVSRIKNWQEPVKSLKEINQDFIQDVKNNVEDIKKIIK